MSGIGRVAWREGQFLRPQHFQQQDRYFEGLVRQSASAMLPYRWGATELTLNHSLAEHGKFGIERCFGMLPDGTPVAIPETAPPPPPLDVPADTRDAIVHLVLPARQAGAQEFARREAGDVTIRSLVEDIDVMDAYSAERLVEQVEIATPQFRFGITSEQTDGRVRLPLARIQEVLNGRVRFDESYIPPSLDIRVSPRLTGFVTDASGRSQQRIDELAVRAAEATEGGADTIVPFLMLQALNRWRPVFEHLRTLPNLHPERLYETFVSAAGELSTFTRNERRPPPFPAYDHENPQLCFEPVFEVLQAALSAAIDRSAGQLALEAVGPGAYTARITDPAIFRTCSLYLVATARTRPDQLRGLSSVVKIGSVAKMRDIVANALQDGVRLLPVVSPPPQIRPLADHVYFELDRSSPEWRELAKSPAMGLHVAGDWPGLRLELWWVRRVST